MDEYVCVYTVHVIRWVYVHNILTNVWRCISYIYGSRMGMCLFVYASYAWECVCVCICVVCMVMNFCVCTLNEWGVNF